MGPKVTKLYSVRIGIYDLFLFWIDISMQLMY